MSERIIQRNEQIPNEQTIKKDKENFEFRLTKEETRHYTDLELEKKVDEMKHYQPKEIIRLFHSCRGGIKDAIKIAESQEGIKQFKLNSDHPRENVTLGIVPMANWSQGFSGGIVYSIPREEVAIEGESIAGKKVLIFRNGCVGIIGPSKESVLSFTDVDASIFCGPETILDKETVDRINFANKERKTKRDKVRSDLQSAVSLQKNLRKLIETNNIYPDRYETHNSLRIIIEEPIVARNITSGKMENELDNAKEILEKSKHAKEEQIAKKLDEINSIKEKIKEYIEQIEIIIEKLTNDGNWITKIRNSLFGSDSRNLEEIQKLFSELEEDRSLGFKWVMFSELFKIDPNNIKKSKRSWHNLTLVDRMKLLTSKEIADKIQLIRQRLEEKYIEFEKKGNDTENQKSEIKISFDVMFLMIKEMRETLRRSSSNLKTI